MQSYKLHLVSEHLKDRHPYIEAPFNDRYDPSEVYHAVFDRSTPKLIEILLMPDIEQYKYRDALITLNEMVSHQEIKDDMITQGNGHRAIVGLVSVASAYLHHTVVEIRREAVLLLGSLVSIKRGRDQLAEIGFEGLSKMLFDSNLLARYQQTTIISEACGWALCRIVTGRDGVDMLCKSNLVKTMIESFMTYSKNPTPDVAKFDIYLLEAFTRILQYDNGIEFFVRCGIVRRLNEILKNTNDAYFNQNFTERVNYLSLDCLAKICANHEGKQEGIDEKIILTASEFLDSPILGESWHSTILVMNCTIHLDGKKQCVHIEEDKIITKLIALLDTKNLEFKKDVKQTLSNISEYPEGFQLITSALASNFKYLEDVFVSNYGQLFGPRVVIALANLLPRTSILERPPQLPIEHIERYKIYALTLGTFLRDYDEALQYAVEVLLNQIHQQTVKIQEKLIPFLPYRSLTDVIAHALYRLCTFDQGCQQGLVKYIITYGDVPIEISKTTLKEEIKSYKKLHEVLLRG